MTGMTDVKYGAFRDRARACFADAGRWAIFLVIGAAALAIASECSPLYAFSHMGDTNVFRFAASRMLDGKELYTDIFDIKGPYIYFLYALGLIISPGGYYGVYVLEVVAALFYFEYTYKSLRALFPDLGNLKIFFGTAAGCLGSYLSLELCGGGEVEEFCLPAYAYVIYLLSNVVRTGNMPRVSQCALVGAHMGLIFWTKYLALAPYVGCFAALLIFCAKNRNFRMAGRIAVRCMPGFLAVTAATLAYSIAAGNLQEMLRIYFYENIFDYEVQKINIFACVYTYMASNLAQILTMGTASLSLAIFGTGGRDNSGMTRYAIIACFAVPAVIIFSTCCAWGYYYLPLTAYNGFFICLALESNICRRRIGALLFSVSLAAAIFAQYAISERLSVFLRRQDIYESHKEIAESLEGCSFLTLNNMDNGLYYLTGYVPDEYYFTRTNARKYEAMRVYARLIKQGSVDAVIIYGYDFDSLCFDIDERDMPRILRYIEEFETYVDFVSENGYGIVDTIPLESGSKAIIYKKGY